MPSVHQHHQHCRDHFSFKKLAEKLNWSQARLDAFFSHKDLSMNSIIQVGFAMGLKIDVVFKPASSTAALTTDQ